MKTYPFLILLSMIFGQSAVAQSLQEIDYQEKQQKLKGLVTSNSGKALPGVLILPAWKGIDQEAKDAALSLEKEGYIAFIADIYGVGNTPADNAAASKISSSYKTDYKAYQARIQAALEALKQQGATDIAVIGYCFGGTGALEAARANMDVQAAVCIHGSLAKAADRTNTVIKPSVLVLHPADDASVSKADYDGLQLELNESKADWQVITYAHSKHTFTNPESADYNELMAKRAWEHTLLFLKEKLIK